MHNDTACLFQMLLSTEDLKMMMDEVSDSHAISVTFQAEETPTGLGTVNLKTFLLIMENSAW